jgi:hypothetical protein
MDPLEQRRADLARHRENRGRLAFTFARFRSEGEGSKEFGAAVQFDTTYIERPTVSYCSEVDLDAFEDALGLGVREEAPLPACSGFVTAWDVDSRGLYVGAWCAISVQFPDWAVIPEDVDVELYHHFTFAGVAIKDVDPELSD